MCNTWLTVNQIKSNHDLVNLEMCLYSHQTILIKQKNKNKKKLKKFGSKKKKVISVQK